MMHLSFLRRLLIDLLRHLYGFRKSDYSKHVYEFMCYKMVYGFRYDTLLVEKEELERLLEDIQQDMVEDCTLDGKIDNTSLRNVIHKLEVMTF